MSSPQSDKGDDDAMTTFLRSVMRYLNKHGKYESRPNSIIKSLAREQVARIKMGDNRMVVIVLQEEGEMAVRLLGAPGDLDHAVYSVQKDRAGRHEVYFNQEKAALVADVIDRIMVLDRLADL